MSAEEVNPGTVVVVASKRRLTPRLPHFSKRVWIIIVVLVLLIGGGVTWYVLHRQKAGRAYQPSNSVTFTHDANGEIVVPAPTAAQIQTAQSATTVSGTVASVSTSSISVTTASGSKVTAELSSATLYEKAPYDVDGKFSDLHAGVQTKLIYYVSNGQATLVEYQP